MFLVTMFVIYIGIALRAALREQNPTLGELRYRILHDLLGLFDRRRRP
jgi:hypothetical protein